MSNISTPCIKVCKLVGNKCEGCGRTFNQIQNWVAIIFREQKKKIMERLNG